MRLIKGKLILSFLAGLLLLISCTPESCIEDTEAYLKATFYKSKTKVKPDSLSAYGFGMINPIYSGIRQISVARLPLNNGATTSEFILKIDTGTDTLTVNYSNYVHLVSKECGYTYFHNIEGITFGTGLIDSVWVINPTTTNDNEENIRIFY
ncbi:MAG TPA: DUF6452 family protein [Bacteroidales bacterium]|nr:DUF6452 family protein [Bacteroidales bacterium]